MVLRLTRLDLPPPDNQLHRYGYNSYASEKYVSWLNIVRPVLQDALGPGHVPDADHWWGVTLRLRLESGDGSNRVKPILDWLGGRYPLSTATLINGKKRQKGTLVNGPGLFENDKRVRWVLPLVVSVRCAEPSFDLVARQVRAPIDERQAAEYAAREAKAAEKDALEKCVRDDLQRLLCWGDVFPMSQIVARLPHGQTAIKRALETFQSEGLVEKTSKGWVGR